MFRRTWVICLLVSLVLAACGGAQTASGPGGAAGTATNGDKLFHQATIGKDNLAGCVSCHSTEPDKQLVGPSLAGIATDAAGAFEETGYKGKAKSAAEWLREAIVDPNVDVVEGFQPNIMPQNFGTQLTDAQLNDLIAYLLTLK